MLAINAYTLNAYINLSTAKSRHFPQPLLVHSFVRIQEFISGGVFRNSQKMLGGVKIKARGEKARRRRKKIFDPYFVVYASFSEEI